MQAGGGQKWQQGIHSSAANEDSCGHSVKQIGTPICVPAGKKLLSKLSNPLCLFPWLFMLPPLNHLPSRGAGALFARPLSAADLRNSFC